MEAHIANQRIQRPYRPIQTYQADPDRRPRQGPFRQENPYRFLRCFKCGEEGHMANDCRTETNRQAMPSRRGQEETRRRDRAHMAQPDVTFREIFSSDDEGPNVAYYPAIRKPGRPSKKPYQKESQAGSSKGKEPVTIYKAPGFDEIDELTDDDIPDIRMSESPSREFKLRKSKVYGYNAWEDIKKRPVEMTFEQAAEMNPSIKQQIRNRLSETKPGFKITQMNSAQPEHEDSQDSEEEKDTRKTSAYAFGSIENTPTEFVIDTGAGGCMIAKDYLDRLGYAIEKPPKLTFTTATGVRAVPLGKVHEIPVKIGNITVPMDMVVVQMTTYEVILGTEWLDKVHAIIDFNAQKMKITRRGKSSIIPIDINRGIRPAMQEEDIEQEAYVMQTVYQNDLEINKQEQDNEPK